MLFPLHLHNATVFDSHMMCRGNTVPIQCSYHAALKANSLGNGIARPGHGRGAAWVRHGMCELTLTNLSIRTSCCNSGIKCYQVSQVECLLILFHILKCFISNPGLDTDYTEIFCGLPQSPRVNARLAPLE